MISKGIKKICTNYWEIENYEKAINDDTHIWHCHHRKEEEGYNRKELIALGLYWNRPAEELIFLTIYEHTSLHMKGNINTLGKHWTEETKEKNRQAHLGKKLGPMTIEHKRKISDSNKGKHNHHAENNPCYGKKWMHNGIERQYVHKDEIQKYLEMGYHFGMK